MSHTIPADAVSLADYERLAAQKLDAGLAAYLNGGAGDERTVATNRKGWGTASFSPRVLADMNGASTEVEVLGRKFASPVMIAPTAYHRLFHADGECGTAAAAAALGVNYVVSTQASTDVGRIAEAGIGAKWFQLYIQADREFTAALVRRVESLGYSALVLTVDAPVNGIRNAEQRAGFSLPEGVEAVNLRGMRPGPTVGSVFDEAFVRGLPTWKDVEWLKSLTGLPVLVKGILSADDASRAVAVGVDGIVVSNHGGRTLDQLPATAVALQDVIAVVGDRVPVIVDGGIRRGTDVLQAMAYGASAVMVGRPILHGLTVAGAAGVAHVLRLLQHELEVAMLLTGCADLKDAARVLGDGFKA